MRFLQGEAEQAGNIGAGQETARGIYWEYMFPINSAVCFISSEPRVLFRSTGRAAAGGS